MLISIAKTASNRIGTLICFFHFLKVSWKFFSPDVALYPYKCTIRLCRECCYHVWAGACSCYLEILDKLQKWICKTVSPSLAASLEPLAHRANEANLSLFYRYHLRGCSSGLVQLVPLLIFEGDLIVIMIDCMIFLSPFLDVLRMIMSTFFFPCRATLWNPLPIECFSLIYDLNSFKSRISGHLLSACFFNWVSCMSNVFVLLFLVTPCLVVAIQSCMEWITIKKSRFKNFKISHTTINRTFIKQYQQIASFVYQHELNLCKQQCFVLRLPTNSCFESSIFTSVF